MKAKKTTKAVTKEGTNAVIAVVEGEGDTEVDVSIRVASRRDEEVATRTDTGEENITTPM